MAGVRHCLNLYAKALAVVMGRRFSEPDCVGSGPERREHPVTTSATPDHTASELEAIEQVVAKVERAQQDALPDEFVASFREDAVWTTAHGKRLIGRDEISEFTHDVLPLAADEPTTAEYGVTQVVFARPDVAVVQIRQRPITRAGEPFLEAPEGRPTYVMAKEADGWKIVMGQNTQVREGVTDGPK